MRTGTRMGVDVGKARIGISRSDPHAVLATPVETVARADGADIARIAALVVEIEPLEIVVGLPLSLSGASTPSTDDAVQFAEALAAAVAVPVRLVDERLSTVTAHGALRSAGRSQKSSRGVIDQVAAVIILQHALDAERGSGRPPGRLLETSGASE